MGPRSPTTTLNSSAQRGALDRAGSDPCRPPRAVLCPPRRQGSGQGITPFLWVEKLGFLAEEPKLNRPKGPPVGLFPSPESSQGI